MVLGRYVGRYYRLSGIGQLEFHLRIWSQVEDVPFPEDNKSWLLNSVTRLGDLLDFGQLFKAFDNN